MPALYVRFERLLDFNLFEFDKEDLHAHKQAKQYARKIGAPQISSPFGRSAPSRQGVRRKLREIRTNGPANKILTTTGKLVNDGETLLYRTKVRDSRGCLLKAQCCPKTSVRKIPRSIYEESRDVARALAKTEAFKQSSRDRKRVEMLFAHLKRSSPPPP